MRTMSDDQLLAHWRARCMDARLCGGDVQPVASVRDRCASWLNEVIPHDGRVALGLSPVGLDAAWFEALAWAGMPLASTGALRWGVDVRRDDVSTPQQIETRLHLPAPSVLRTMTGIGLKPIRMFVAQRLGCRLLGAPGIRLWLWPQHAVLLSQSDIPLEGFVYGNIRGHRATLALKPYANQVITW